MIPQLTEPLSTFAEEEEEDRSESRAEDKSPAVALKPGGLQKLLRCALSTTLGRCSALSLDSILILAHRSRFLCKLFRAWLKGGPQFA